MQKEKYMSSFLPFRLYFFQYRFVTPTNIILPTNVILLIYEVTFICSKSTIETLEKGVKYVQN